MIAPVAGAARKGEPRIPVEDRLFSLVLALLATETGLLKSEILSTVRGYAERYDSSGSERQPRAPVRARQGRHPRARHPARDRGVARPARRQPVAAVPHPQGPVRPARRGAVHARRARAARPRRRGLARGVALGRLAARAHEAPLARHRAARARHRLRAAAAGARRRVRAAAAGARPPADRALPLLQARRAARRASARSNPLAVVLHEGRWHLHALRSSMPADRARSCCRASSAASSPCPGSTFDAPPPGIQDRVLAELDELRLAQRRRPRRHRGQRRRGAARQARDARATKTRGSSGCTTRMPRCSPTSSPPTVPRCACVAPDVPARRPCASASRRSPPRTASRRSALMAKRARSRCKAPDKLVFLLSLVPYLLEQRGRRRRRGRRRTSGSTERGDPRRGAAHRDLGPARRRRARTSRTTCSTSTGTPSRTTT